jgi:AraC-like DNA-binding protein
MTPSIFTRLCRTRDRLREAPQQRFGISALAREAAMSRFQLIRRFRALFGVTPHQCLIEARIDRAKLLLAVTNYSITRVCLDVGFVSLGSFSASFRRRVGLTPSAWRRRARLLKAAPRVQPRELIPGCLTLMATAFAISEKPSLLDASDCAP